MSPCGSVQNENFSSQTILNCRVLSVGHIKMLSSKRASIIEGGILLLTAKGQSSSIKLHHLQLILVKRAFPYEHECCVLGDH